MVEFVRITKRSGRNDPKQLNIFRDVLTNEIIVSNSIIGFREITINIPITEDEAIDIVVYLTKEFNLQR